MLILLKKVKNILWFAFLVAIFLSFNAPRIAIAVLLSIFLHESGHALVFALLGKKVRGIEMRGFGAQMLYRGTLSYREELLIALGGPLINILTGAICLFLFSGGGEFVVIFASVNFFYGLSNLLPFPSYDGEKILYIVFTLAFGYTRGEKILSLLSFATRCALLFLSLYLIFYFDIAYGIFGCVFLSLLPEFTKKTFSDKE